MRDQRDPTNLGQAILGLIAAGFAPLEAADRATQTIPTAALPAPSEPPETGVAPDLPRPTFPWRAGHRRPL